MGGVYPELKEAKQLIIEITKKEEERFLETLGFGLKLLNEEIKKLKQKDIDFISGASTFKLYDTYGFPIDIISDVAKEENLKVDVAGFEKIMSLQKSRAREAQKATSSVLSGINIYTRLSYQGEKTRFLGYDTLKVKSKITHLIKKAKETETIKAQEEGELITKETPFYGESGGQVGDSGFITSTKGIAKVKDTQIVGTLFIHLITVTKGQLSRGDEVELRVNRGRRSAITSNHTATHLLQAALRKTLGTHVKQAGSLVAPERIRFDFTHFGSLTSKVLEKIELLVNNAIRENLPVESKQMPLVEAIKSGAIAIFEEKYSDIVRVIFIPKWSKELCGGTHVRRTGDIGYFKIISESSIAAGVRRIEAVTAEAAITYIQKKEHLLEELSHILKVKPIDILAKVKRILKELREREKEISTLKTALAIKQTQQLLRTIRYINGIAVIASEISSVDAKTLREMGDRLRGKLKSGVVVLGSCSNGKVILVAMVSKDLTSHIRAKDIIKKVAPLIGGEGGGRPDMAQAGGRYPQNLAQALEAVYKTISSLKT
jgi:alanyl-tRNA synthetase